MRGGSHPSRGLWPHRLQLPLLIAPASPRASRYWSRRLIRGGAVRTALTYRPKVPRPESPDVANAGLCRRLNGAVDHLRRHETATPTAVDTAARIPETLRHNVADEVAGRVHQKGSEPWL